MTHNVSSTIPREQLAPVNKDVLKEEITSTSTPPQSVSSISRALWKLSETWRIANARLRTHLWSLRGASITGKCLFGQGVQLDRPWTASFGRRCMLEPHVWFDVATDHAQIKIGNNVFLGRGVHLLVREGITIGDDSLIGDGVIISDHKHEIVAGSPIGRQPMNSAPVHIGTDVLICVRAVILQGVTIGDGAIIGPGAVVTQDVKPNAIVGIAPARAFGTRPEAG